MLRKLDRRVLLTSGPVGFAALGSVVAMKSTRSSAQEASGTVLEIAGNGKTFAYTPPKGSEDATNGAPFIIQGHIYPEGTLVRPETGPANGILADGSPEFPDAVIGLWYCKGWFVNDGLAATTGPQVATTQIYDLNPDEPGRHTLLSEGIELADRNVPFMRSVIGGTGKHAGARGEVTQTTLPDNPTGAPSFVFAFHLGSG